jgi:hypothetical protein
MSVGGVAGKEESILSWYFGIMDFTNLTHKMCWKGRGLRWLRNVHDERKDALIEVVSTRGGKIDLYGLKPMSLMLRYWEMVRGGPSFFTPPRTVMEIRVEGGKSVHQFARV